MDRTAKWKQVSSDAHCPICKKPDWCRISTDGKWCACRRESRGAKETKQYRDGTEAYMHLLRDDPPNGKPHATAKPSGNASSSPTPTADAETRDRAYRMLLAVLQLSKPHGDNLRARGLSDEHIEAGGYKTLPRDTRHHAMKLWHALGDAAQTIPGLTPTKILAPAGLLVPVRDLMGRIIAVRIRPDAPGDGGKYRYLSSRNAKNQDGPSPGSPAHIPLGITATCPVARITEGELKADATWRLSGVPTVSFPGVASWRTVLGVLAELRCKTVRVAFDADAGSNSNVARSLMECAKELAALGYAIELERWPVEAGKGIDDLLQAGGTPEVLTGPEALQAVRDIAKAAGVPEVGEPETTAAEWPELARLDEQQLPEFPTHVLPTVLREWVAAESHATQTPADLAGLLSLAVVSSCIARHVNVDLPGWREPVNLFVAVLLEPANRKSAVFSDATRPLREVEAEQIEKARGVVAWAQSKRRQEEQSLKKLEKQAAEKGDQEAGQQAGELAARLAEELEPVLPRLMVDDATAERLGMMLAEQGGRIASMSPEGGVFDLMAGMYSKSGMPQFGVYLMGHSGDDLKTDRVSRKAVYVERPALTCAYAIQPQVIEGLAQNAAFRGRGLLARFLYAAPRSWIGERLIAPAIVPVSVATAYTATVADMAKAPPAGNLFLTPDAMRIFRDWESEVEGMLAEGGTLEAIRDWGGKLAGATLRLAAVLHCVTHPRDAINIGICGNTIQGAVEIARYLIPHAEAVLTMMQAHRETTTTDAAYVLRWIKRHGLREFTKTQAHHAGKRRFPKADDVDPALSELTKRGYIRLLQSETAGPGRPPSPTYELNPAAFSFETAENRSQNSQNSPNENPESNCGNIRNASGQSENADQGTDPPQDDDAPWGEV